MISLTAMAAAHKRQQLEPKKSPTKTEQVFQETVKASNKPYPTFDEKKIGLRSKLLSGHSITLGDARNLIRTQKSKLNDQDEYGYTILDYTNGKENTAIKLLRRNGAEKSPDPMIFPMDD